MSAANEMRTVEEFRGVTAQPVGVVAVTDTATGNKIHRASCRYVTEDNFRAKVVEGGNKNGRYFFYLRPEDAVAETRSEWCAVCG